MLFYGACSDYNAENNSTSVPREHTITQKYDFLYPEPIDESGFPRVPDYNIQKNESFHFEKPPWGGTVSHHLLTAPYIESWFTVLKENNPDIKRFFIISPRHFDDGIEKISISNKSWEVPGYAPISAPSDIISSLKDKLSVTWDHNAFTREHGISVLLPYIRRFFPEAAIIPMLQQERPIPSQELHLLADYLKTFFEATDDSDNFLMISSDFVHHMTLDETNQLDVLSENLFNDFQLQNWHLARNDNQGGMLLALLLAELRGGSKARIQYHLNNTHIMPDETDITSYFFTFFY